MKRVKTLSVLVLLTLFMVVPMAKAMKPNVADFEWWQFYEGWGPGEYYGQKVLVHYTAVNRWTLQKIPIDEGFKIVQARTQIGTAEVFDATTGLPFTDSWGHSGLMGDLIDPGLKFHAVENTKGIAYTDKPWYHVLEIDEVEEWNYHWIINGVYHYIAQEHNGEFSLRIPVP